MSKVFPIRALTGDPMLMVDGDAFVTFYRKDPW